MQNLLMVIDTCVDLGDEKDKSIAWNNIYVYDI